MPGTRTAPAVAGAPAFRLVSLHYIDSTSVNRSISNLFTFALATDANVEDWAAQNSDISNASLWKVTVQDQYIGVEDGSNALDAPVQSVKDNLVMSAFDVADPTDTRAALLIAPEDSVFLAGTRVVDPTNVDLVALMDAYLLLLGGTYTITGATFNQNTARGKKQKF